MIRIWSLVFGTPIFRILALNLNFEGAKSIHVLKVLIWDSGGCQRFLTKVSHLDLNLDMVPGLWYTHVLNLGSLLFILKVQGTAMSLSPDLGLWRTLEVPDWGLAS